MKSRWPFYFINLCNKVATRREATCTMTIQRCMSVCALLCCQRWAAATQWPDASERQGSLCALLYAVPFRLMSWVNMAAVAVTRVFTEYGYSTVKYIFFSLRTAYTTMHIVAVSRRRRRARKRKERRAFYEFEYLWPGGAVNGGCTFESFYIFYLNLQCSYRWC